MSEIILLILISIGSLFVLLAAVGVVRMPDLYTRISVTTKAATLGIGLILVGAAVYFNEVSVTSRIVAIVFFIILTAPVGAHLLGRASYFTGISLWPKSIMDDLEGKYKKSTHELESGEETESTKTKG